jgi:hypothetical protein
MFHQSVNAECVSHLVVLKPGEALSRQDEPVLLGPALDDADVVDGQPAFTDHL